MTAALTVWRGLAEPATSPALFALATKTELSSEYKWLRDSLWWVGGDALNVISRCAFQSGKVPIRKF
jgi:hypothetical protein